MLNLPNTITLARIALVAVFTVAACYASRWDYGYTIALGAFALAGFSDWLDGYLARKLNEVTTFGKLIDPLADKILVAAAFVYITSVNLCPAWVTIVIIMREFLVTGIRQIAQDQGVIIPADTSGKWKAAFQMAFCTGVLLALSSISWGDASPAWVQMLASWCYPTSEFPILYHITLWGSLVLTIYSGLFYCIHAKKLIFKR